MFRATQLILQGRKQMNLHHSHGCKTPNLTWQRFQFVQGRREKYHGCKIRYFLRDSVVFVVVQGKIQEIRERRNVLWESGEVIGGQIKTM